MAEAGDYHTIASTQSEVETGLELGDELRGVQAGND